MSNLTRRDFVKGAALLAALPIPTIQLNQTAEGMDETLKQTLEGFRLARAEMDAFEEAAHKWHLGQKTKSQLTALFGLT